MIARLEVHRTQEGGVVDVGVVAEEVGVGGYAAAAKRGQARCGSEAKLSEATLLQAKVNELETHAAELREAAAVSHASSMWRGWRLLARSAAAGLAEAGAGMQLQRGCMPRPLAVWKRLTSRLEKAAASEIELKLALDTARSEVTEVCMELRRRKRCTKVT